MNDDEIIVGGVSEVTPHNKALYEAGKKLLIESIDVGREFCKFMTTTTLSAIPVYIALLQLLIPKDHTLNNMDVVFLIPPVLFLLSSMIFILGYFPLPFKVSLDLVSEIDKEREATIKHRFKFALYAFLIFSVGIIYGIWLLFNKLPIN